MTFLRVCVEGVSDEPVVREVLVRKLGLARDAEFAVLVHDGKGKRRTQVSSPPIGRRGLLDLLPNRLSAWSKAARTQDLAIAVLVDADDEDCRDLKQHLLSLEHRPPRTLFRIAVEETESWFLADPQAIRSAYPRAHLDRIPRNSIDRVIGATEVLARVLGDSTGRPSEVRKKEWAEAIVPHLNLDQPASPSLRTFIAGLERLLGRESNS